MKKIYCILFILSLFSNFSECIEESLQNNNVSKLIGMVRTEIIDKSLLYLPKRKEVNILQMINQMMKEKDKYSLNEAESVYLVFKQISQIFVTSNKDEESDDPIYVYNSGKGTPNGISSLFNNICTFLRVVSDSISGYLKSLDSQRRIECEREYTWNYVEIDGEYYFIDVSILSDVMNNYWSDYFYLFFGTEPEIFIRLHFPKESKWQLLSEPYTFEKYEFMALLFPFFYLLGFKTISPDTTILPEMEKLY